MVEKNVIKTVGTITFHTTSNYGGVLQAYALQRVLIGMGYRAEIIDYYDPGRHLASLSLGPKVRHLLWHRVIKKALVGSLREERTERFRHDHLRLSAARYRDAADLHDRPPLYDAYITGSDQVWNPGNNFDDSSYFLTFAPPGKRRISYAASFGLSELDDGRAERYSRWLSGLDHLSTRETEGKAIIRRLTGRDAEVLLDPTLLLDRDDWSEIAAARSFWQPYILCYCMPGDRRAGGYMAEAADRLARRTGWKAVWIGLKEYMRLHPFRHTALTAGPAQFLRLFLDASFVVTNSFHGMAFSLNFKTPFLAVINGDLPREKSLSSRIITLATTAGVCDRVATPDCGPLFDHLLESDFAASERALSSERRRARVFLKEALG